MSQPDLPEKPTRTFSKRMTGLSLIAAWVTIWVSMWLGAAMAVIIVPLMVPAILGLVSAYQAVGHFDLRTLAGKMANKAPAETVPTEFQSDAG